MGSGKESTGRRSRTGTRSMRLLGLAHRFGEHRQHFEHVADDAVVGDLEDRRFLVLVDRDDGLATCAFRRDAESRPKSRTRRTGRDSPAGPSGRSDRVRTPTVVGHGARRADRRVAECRREIFDQLEVLRRPCRPRPPLTITGASPRSSFAELPADQFLRHHPRRRRIHGRRDRFHACRSRCLRRRHRAGTQRHDRRRSRNGQRRDHLAGVHRMPNDDRVARGFERRHVGAQAHAKLRRDTRREVAPLAPTH